MKSMNPNKAPRPDGFNAAFYQQFWPVIGTQVMQKVLKCLNERDDIGELNETFIVLIPKVNDAQSLKEYQPISLCNMSYKIIAKVLANRIKLHLLELIDEG